MEATYAVVLGGGSTPQRWPNPPRDPLPAFPPITAEQPAGPYASCWAAEPYATTLPPIPATPDRRFHRGNVIGVRVPGLTDGVYPKDRSVDTTWSWTAYADAVMRKCADYHFGNCGYTHVSLSLGHLENQGKPLTDLRRVMDYWHDLGDTFVSLNAGSGGQPFAVYRDRLEQLVAWEALIPGRDLVCSAWQIDKWYDPPTGIQKILDTGAWAHDHALLNVVHWGGGYPGWAENCAMWDAETDARWGIHDRGSFQRVLGADLQRLDGHYGQCNTEADIGQVQSWIRKIIQVFPPGMFFVAAEMDMQAEADAPKTRLEAYGDLKAYLAQCTAPNDGVQISSFNGSRGTDGRVLLPA